MKIHDLRDLEKMRAGNPDGDGGYVIVVAPPEYHHVLLSYGIATDISFECDFARTYPKCRVHFFDHTVDAPPAMPPDFTFHKEGLAACKGKSVNTLAAHFAQVVGKGESVFLKIDIEGAEYDSLLATPERLFQGVTQLAIELHDVTPTNHSLVPLLKMLNKEFVPVHIHANNTGQCITWGGVPVPAVLEVTYVSRDQFEFAGRSTGRLPTPLDRPNDPNLPDLPVEF